MRASKPCGTTVEGLVLGDHRRALDAGAGRKIGAPIDRHVLEFRRVGRIEQPALLAAGLAAMACVPRRRRSGTPAAGALTDSDQLRISTSTPGIERP